MPQVLRNTQRDRNHSCLVYIAVQISLYPVLLVWHVHSPLRIGVPLVPSPLLSPWLYQSAGQARRHVARTVAVKP